MNLEATTECVSQYDLNIANCILRDDLTRSAQYMNIGVCGVFFGLILINLDNIRTLMLLRKRTKINKLLLINISILFSSIRIENC